jgi:hypothetical protein
MKTSIKLIPIFAAMFLCAGHPLAGQERSGPSDEPAMLEELDEKQGAWLHRHGTKLLAAVLGLAIGIVYGRRKQPPRAG